MNPKTSFYILIFLITTNSCADQPNTGNMTNKNFRRAFCKAGIPGTTPIFSLLSRCLKPYPNRHVYENYNATTGAGGNVRNSDAFYSWGGLLALIALMENEYY